MADRYETDLVYRWIPPPGYLTPRHRLETDIVWRWIHPSGWGPQGRYEWIYQGGFCSGVYQGVILVDRDEEPGDPPPPGAKPVGRRVYLRTRGEQICVASKWSDAATGIVTFTHLNPAYSYWAHAFGFERTAGGRWNAVIQDELTLEPMT